MQKLREFKFVVQPVLMVVEGGKTVGEHVADPVVLYGVDQLRTMADNFSAELERENQKLRKKGPVG